MSSVTEKSPGLKDRRVLIVDEHPHSLRFLQELCRSFGLNEIASAQTVDQALLKLEQARFDILVCTWGRGVDAIQFTRRIRADGSRPYQKIRIIVLRVEATVADVVAVRDAGADEFLAMPVSQGAFQAALHRVTTAPQHFVDCDVYKGPCRRRRRLAWENERRRVQAKQKSRETEQS